MKIKLGLYWLWQKIRQHPIATGIVVVLIILTAFAFLVHRFGWNWTGFNGGFSKTTTTSTARGITTTTEYPLTKTLWDWLQLFIVPIVLAIGGFWLNQIQKSREEKAAKQRTEVEQEIASDKQREDALQEYINKMSELLLEKKLRESTEGSEARTIARVRTTTLLSRLDAERKGSVVRFLYESDLIHKGKRIVDLSGADLTKADLHVADLRGVDLRGAKLRRSFLRGINLIEANLEEIDLSRTDLDIAHLSGTILTNAHLDGANLHWAELDGADLNKAWLIFAELEGAILREASLQGANLRGADLSHANLSKADLSHADLSKADLDEANMSEANLQGANLQGANLGGVGPTTFTIGFSPDFITRLHAHSVTAGEAMVMFADMKEILKEANLPSKADQLETDKRGVDRRGAFRYAADQHGANLSTVNLTGADLSEANLKGAIGITTEDLEKQAKSLKGAIMPNGDMHS